MEYAHALHFKGGLQLSHDDVQRLRVVASTCVPTRAEAEGASRCGKQQDKTERNRGHCDRKSTSRYCSNPARACRLASPSMPLQTRASQNISLNQLCPTPLALTRGNMPTWGLGRGPSLCWRLLCAPIPVTQTVYKLQAAGSHRPATELLPAPCGAQQAGSHHGLQLFHRLGTPHFHGVSTLVVTCTVQDGNRGHGRQTRMVRHQEAGSRARQQALSCLP